MSPEAAEAVVALDTRVDVDVVRAALPAGTRLRTVMLAEGNERALAALAESGAHLLIIETAEASEPALDLIREARRRHEDCVIVALHSERPNGFLRRAFQMGADDLIEYPQSGRSLAFDLEKAIARRRGPAASAGRLGSFICVVGAKGGTGKTLTACNLAIGLAVEGKRVALVDVDLQFGDVGLALGLEPQRTIYDLALAAAAGPLDPELVGQYLTRHDSGVDVLLAPVRPDQAGAIDTRFLRSVYSILRSTHDYVVADTAPAFTPEVIASIDASSHLCVVGMLDALSLKDTKIGLDTLALMGLDPDAASLVLNRADTSVGISQHDVEQILGRRPGVLVPSDRAIPRSLTDAQPIITAHPRSGAARAFRSLADIYLRQGPAPAEETPAPTDADEQPRRVLLRRR